MPNLFPKVTKTSSLVIQKRAILDEAVAFRIGLALRSLGGVSTGAIAGSVAGSGATAVALVLLFVYRVHLLSLWPTVKGFCAFAKPILSQTEGLSTFAESNRQFICPFFLFICMVALAGYSPPLSRAS